VSLGTGPSAMLAAVLAAAEPSPIPLLILIGLGFFVGVTGHILHSKPTIATGIGLIFLGSVGLPLLLYLSDR
jgi:Na+/phosphate symporter